jgi:hypothetical protein
MRARLAKWLGLGIAACTCAICGCGTPGVPQAPSLNLAKPVSDLQATRVDNKVNLSWTVPSETTDGAKFRHRGLTRICRAVDQATIGQCDGFATQPTPPTKQTANFSSELPQQSTGPNDYVTYAVEVQNRRGRSAGLSNQVRVPAAIVSNLSGAPNFQVTPEVVLATASVNLRDPAVPQSLELRRKEKGQPQESAVANRPLDFSGGQSATLELRDDTFVWEKTYEYRVVVVGSEQIPNETAVAFDADTSAPTEVFAHDIFPPAIPTGLVAVFSGQFAGQQPAIDLTWNPDTDRDLAGYFVYRRLEQEPPGAVTKLNPQPIAAPSYHDTAIQPGNMYVYTVAAVDQRGNESKQSEAASEQVPK